MLKFSNDSEVAGDARAILIAKIDKRVVPALDQIAETNQVNTAQLMSQFFSDIADVVVFLGTAQDGSFDTIEDRIAKLIIQRCREATPESLRAIGRIWDRAAELKAQQGGDKG